MLELTSEQRARVNRCRVYLDNEMQKGTINHCLRLFNQGMVSEAVEILADFQEVSESQAYMFLLNKQG